MLWCVLASAFPGLPFYFGLFDRNMVLALNQAARIVLSHYVMEPDIARQCAEEGNSVSNEDGHSSDNEAVNEACAQECIGPRVSKVFRTSKSRVP